MKITFQTTPGYDVLVEKGIIHGCGEAVKAVLKPQSQIMIVSETNVFPLYGKMVEDSLKTAGFKVSRFIFDAGEQSKNLRTVGHLYERLSEKGFTRSDSIAALGGGVTGDLAGFAAATFLRGIAYVQIPTSLLAQVDSSVGGKTGVDLPFGKNLVGAFHQPSLVLTDPDVLSSLPRHYRNDGMGEVIKYGCIDDGELFDMLGTDGAQDIGKIIVRCIDSKRRFVEADIRDQSRRMILNFGHTFGHAIEKLQDFKGLAHGEAVAVGMVIAAGIGERLGVTKNGVRERIETLLRRYDLPVDAAFGADELIQAAKMDKKSDGEELHLILLTDIGNAVIHKLHKKELQKLM